MGEDKMAGKWGIKTMIRYAEVDIVHALNRALRLKPFNLSVPVPIYRKRSAQQVISRKNPIIEEVPAEKIKRARRELLDAGVTVYGLLKSESRVVPKLLHPEEHVEAVIYGQHNASSAMLVATDERILYIDKKPMAVFLDEVSYEVISGIEFDIHTLFATVVLHTPVKNYEFRFVNLHCAENFARHIEKHRLEREPKDHKEIEAPAREVITNIQSKLPLKDMAGYYWLPNDEEERLKLQRVVTEEK